METDTDRLPTLLIGLDAACSSVLDPLLEADRLPNLAAIFERGAVGPLESQIPPWTPSAWPSLYTGVNPGKHGVFSFLSFDGYDWDVVNATDVRERTLWETLDFHGLRSVVVNAPVTSPPPEIDGAIVPGYTAPENPECHPPGLLDEIRTELGDYRVYPEHDDTPESYRAGAEAVTRMRGQAFRYLVDRFEPDFGFVQFQQTDTVFHEHPTDEDTVGGIYEAVDAEVGQILDECEPETIVIASDHGIGPYNGYEVRVNDALRQHDLVATKRGGEGMPSWSTIASDSLAAGRSGGRRGQTGFERALALAASVGITSQRAYKVLRTVGLDGFVVRHVPTGAIRAATEQVDFPMSKAYMRARIECGVRLNVEGREPDGVVSPDEYGRVRNEVIDALRSVRTPTDEPVFEDVAPREEYFEGPYVEEAVDVVTVPANFDHFLSAQLRGSAVDSELTEPWNHKRNGIVAVAGDSIDAEADLTGAHLFDVAPTILATLGLPHATRMDGKPLACVNPVGDREYPSYEVRSSRSTDDAAVEARLSDLGYLE